jgi:hypothetical protein
MTTALLVVALFNTSIETGQNISVVVHSLKWVHHHTTRPAYRHVLKPIAKEVAK